MVLLLPLRSPACETGAFGDVPVLDAVAVALDEGGVPLFAVHRDQATLVVLDVGVRSLPSLSAASQVAISGDGPDAVITLSSPDRVVPKTPGDPELDGGPAGRAAAAVVEHDPGVLATAVPGRRCMSF
jgi:alpha-L-arabinofuranosidase